MGNQLFGFWRQSIDRKQSIFCISNVANEPVALRLSELNLIVTDEWLDLISGDTIDDIGGEYEVRPYQTLWLTNLRAAD